MSQPTYESRLKTFKRFWGKCNSYEINESCEPKHPNYQWWPINSTIRKAKESVRICETRLRLRNIDIYGEVIEEIEMERVWVKEDYPITKKFDSDKANAINPITFFRGLGYFYVARYNVFRKVEIRRVRP